MSAEEISKENTAGETSNKNADVKFGKDLDDSNAKTDIKKLRMSTVSCDAYCPACEKYVKTKVT